MSKPLRLSDLDTKRTADELVWALFARTARDARSLGCALKADQVPAGTDPKMAGHAAVEHSQAMAAARICVEWATAGRGKPEAVATALRDLRAMIEGVEPGQAVGREVRALTPATPLVVLAAMARLSVLEGRPVEAVELAALASVDERSIRAAAQAGTLRPVGNGRPMRFEAELVRRFLYERGIPGFVAVPLPPARAAG
jgi:hypothetical protein